MDFKSVFLGAIFSLLIFISYSNFMITKEIYKINEDTHRIRYVSNYVATQVDYLSEIEDEKMGFAKSSFVLIHD